MTQTEANTLHRRDLDPDPIAQLGRWFDEAAETMSMPEAACLATIGLDRAPDARMVLVKGVGTGGLRFFTNFGSAKGEQLEADPRAALVFHWPGPPQRQVRVRGQVESLPAADSDAYFAGRPRDSQLGAWASPQSRVLGDRGELEAAIEAAGARFTGVRIPRPREWGGYLLIPAEVELWQGRAARVHDRFRYKRKDEGTPGPGGQWSIERLAP